MPPHIVVIVSGTDVNMVALVATKRLLVVSAGCPASLGMLVIHCLVELSQYQHVGIGKKKTDAQ